jgi:hypothetical protein
MIRRIQKDRVLLNTKKIIQNSELSFLYLDIYFNGQEVNWPLVAKVLRQLHG